MITIILVIILIILLVLILRSADINEGFIGEVCMGKFYPSIVDPYSIFLHRDASDKAAWWNFGHNRKLYYYRDMVPQRYKE